MKKLIFFTFVMMVSMGIRAQVAINTDGSAANSKAMLDISSDTLGMLIPRMTTAQRITFGNTLSATEKGMMVYDTDEAVFYFYDGTQWAQIATDSSKWVHTSQQIYPVDSNYNVGIGTTNPTGKFQVTTLLHAGTYGSDQCTGGTATASETYGAGFEADKAFDNDNDTHWDNNNNLPAWLQYDFGSGNEKRIAKYRMYYTNPSSDYSHSPNNWTFQSSNDGSTWTTLDTQTGEGWTTNGWKEFTFSNTTQYRYYRINITDNKGTVNNFVSVYEMEMMEETLTNDPTFTVLNNNVGIGTASPTKTLDVNGSLRLADGSEAAGKILSSDASGTATWVDGATVNGGGWTVNGNYIYNTGDSIGIGTAAPQAPLDVHGRIEQTGTGGSVFLGEDAGLNDDLNSNYNVFLGHNAGRANISGDENTACGEGTLEKNTTGTENTAIGRRALLYNTTGSHNTANGVASLFNNTTGNYNTASGFLSLYSDTIGGYNTANGSYALYSNTTGYRNVANGSYALYSNTTGSSNVAMGTGALYSNTDLSNLVAIGDSALYNNGVGGSGYQALNNTALGAKALYANTIGNVNTACGFGALYHNINGSENTASGSYAMYSNTTGSSNVANGNEALYYNTTGYCNTASGYRALFCNTSGYYNTACGHGALLHNKTGIYNTACGVDALEHDTVGIGNTACGSGALNFLRDGNYNTALGFNSGPAGYSYDTLSNTTALGNGATVTASNTIHIGNTSVTQISGQVGWSTYSDKRFKTNVRQDVPGLDFILKLQPVTYRWDIHKLDAFLGKDDSIVDASAREKQESITYTGFLAQDVEQAAQETGYNFSGVVHPQNDKSPYSLRYAEFVVPLVKAVQEQEATIEQQQKTISQQKQALEKQRQINSKQQQAIDALTERLEKLEKNN